MPTSKPYRRLRPYATLRAFFNGSGWTHAQLARQVACHPSEISRILNGRRRPSLKLAVRIAQATNVPVESIAADASARLAS